MQENAGASEVKLDNETVARLDELINEDTIAGRRYTDGGMAASDAEQD